MQHIIRHIQQDKTKEECLDQLSGTTALWIRDFYQKFLPMRFRGGQCDYFRKKRMTLHADVFCLRDNKGIIKKSTYFTTLFRSDQDFQDTLSLVDHKLRQFSDDPNVNELYAKSDNAGCYQCKVCPESLYKIFKKSGIILKQLDFNEF